MRIHIRATNERLDGEYDVTFLCTCGEGKARWLSRGQRPLVGQEFDVEVDIDEVVAVGKNARPSDGPVRLSHDDVYIDMTVTVDSVDADDVAYLRLQRDALIMVETEGELERAQGLSIRLPFESLTITPIGIAS